MAAFTLSSELLTASCQELAAYGYALQNITQRYPWFAIGHILLFRSLCGLGGEAYMSETEKAALYAGSRSDLFFALEESRMEPPVDQDNIEENTEVAEEVVPEIISETVVRAGMDYFGKEDFADVSLDQTQTIDRFIASHPKIIIPAANAPEAEQQASSHVVEDDFVTETLAKIYAQQGYLRLAINCYEKLILLYPKKSTYFASLIEELKQKVNT